MTLYVGTSGFAYKEWKPDFYPADVPATRFLEHYGTRLAACEINATFYRLQKPETIARWGAATPSEFRFSVKAHRRLTHSRNFGRDDEWSSFLESYLKSVSGLGDRLGTILFQFPPYRQRDDEALGTLLGALIDSVPCAFEFRHDSWSHEDVTRAIIEAGHTVCVSNTDGTVPAVLPAGPIAYVRLRTDGYTDQARQGWSELLAAEAATRPVFAFSKHEGGPASDPHGGVGLAVWLRSHGIAGDQLSG